MADNDAVVDAGCVEAPDARAGCAQAAGEIGPSGDAPPPVAGDGAGCAAPAAADDESSKATPPATVREFERALRGLGFTRQQAAHIARHGFAEAHSAPAEPADTELLALRAAVERRAAALKG
jgi:hypothetical protein